MSEASTPAAKGAEPPPTTTNAPAEPTSTTNAGVEAAATEPAPATYVPAGCSHYVEVVTMIIGCDALGADTQALYRRTFETTKENWKLAKYDPATGNNGAACAEAARAFEDLIGNACDR